tara:strand:- start:191 stop:595 length:405 start_codon:yes stop_codon:yes gene_type:complete
MTDEEIKEEEKNSEGETPIWTIEDLVALTDVVQTKTTEFRGKNFSFQFCELVEKEEPKFALRDDFKSEPEKMEYYSKIGSQRVLAMIEKANGKNPEGKTVDSETWGKLPTTLRYQISNDIMGVETEIKEDFQSE